jgi:hypothetical protein
MRLLWHALSKSSNSLRYEFAERALFLVRQDPTEERDWICPYSLRGPPFIIELNCMGLSGLMVT